jgi:NADH dehydrogenase [ubiquinone] 1 alpha subcomplex assembly factor 5
VCDEEFLPFASQSLDFLSSFLTMHSASDVEACMKEAKRVVKPQGLYMGCMLGGATLATLKEAMPTSVNNMLQVTLIA